MPDSYFGIGTEALEAIRDALPADPQLRDFALRREAVTHRVAPVDLARAVAALPAPPELTGAERSARDLADLRAARDDAARRGYSATAAKLTTAVKVVERTGAERQHRRDADAIMRGWRRPRPAAADGPGPETRRILADHAGGEALRLAGEALAEVRAARRALVA